MDIQDFKAGKLKPAYQYQYFLPDLINHDFSWSNPETGKLLEQASLKLGELNSFSKFVPDTDMFIKMHILKEAVVSSKIEGTRTNIEDALSDASELDPEKRDDWLEVNNYVKAINNAIDELEHLPLSNRLLRKTHKILLASGRGEHKTPGEFRTSQNWIGGATLHDALFIPPAPDELPELLSDFEKFLYNDRVPHLIKIAIAHYQFETIHPFLDGNGRIGRLLITLYFVSQAILEKPLLYLSDFLEKNRTNYYDNLNRVREKNDLEHWIHFFLIGVSETAQTSVETLKNIMALKQQLETHAIIHMGKRSKNAMILLHALFKNPVIRIRQVQEITSLSAKAANDLIKEFVCHNILVEVTGYRRNRIFVFKHYLKLFEK